MSILVVPAHKTPQSREFIAVLTKQHRAEAQFGECLMSCPTTQQLFLGRDTRCLEAVHQRTRILPARIARAIASVPSHK